MAGDDSSEITAALAAKYTGWIPPPEAVALFLEQGWQWDTTVKAIGARMHSGLVETMARHVVTPEGERMEYVVLKHEFLAKYWAPGYNRDFWKTGDVAISGGGTTGYGDDRLMLSLFSVRFDPEGIHAMLPAKASQNPASQPVPDNGQNQRRGAKRKDWWDHLWIEMIRRIQAGTLNPKNQAELQTILEDYIGNTLGENYGDSTLKPMASNLFKFLNENRGNLGGD